MITNDVANDNFVKFIHLRIWKSTPHLYGWNHIVDNVESAFKTIVFQLMNEKLWEPIRIHPIAQAFKTADNKLNHEC